MDAGNARPIKQLRDYQEAALNKINERFDAGINRQLFSAATGAGKTECFAFLIKQRIAQGGNALVLTHRDRLTLQAADRIRGIVGWGQVGLVNGDKKEWYKPIVSATVQSACNEKQLERAPRFSTIIIDEAHRASSPSYLKVVNKLLAPGGLLLGVTATPNRTDKKGLIPDVFQELVFEIGMQELIDKEYLCPVIGTEIKLPIDLSSLRTQIGTDGIKDFRADDVMAAFEQANWLEAITAGWKEVASDRRTIVFVPPGVVDGKSCGMAHSLAEYMRLQGIRAAAVDGNTPQREQDRVIDDFTAGRIQVLTNVNIFCLDDQTEILTGQGWRTIDTIQSDDLVANWDNGNVYFEQPSQILKRQRMPNERMVVLETKNRSIRVSENHRMVWQHPNWPNYHIDEAKDLVGKVRALPVCGKAEPFSYQVPQEAKRSRIQHNHRVASLAYHYRNETGCSSAESLALAKANIAERESLAYTQPQDLSIADCQFIGFWIGDGTKGVLQSGGVEYKAAQSCVYPNIIKWFDSVIAATNFHSVRKERHRPNINYIEWSFGRGTGFGPQKRSGLYRIEPYLQKQGTDLFWALSDEQFHALLVGFWYADGVHGKAELVPESLTLCNNSYQLLSLLQAIASTRGYGTRITKGFNHQVNPNHQQNYKLLIYKGQSHAMTKFRLQFEGSEWKEERLWCVTVPSGCIITRRRGSVTVMGNCEGLDIPPIDCVLFARLTLSSIVYSQSIGRGGRLFPGKENCLVIDITGMTQTLAAQGQTLMTLGKILPTKEQKECLANERLRQARALVKKIRKSGADIWLEGEGFKTKGEIKRTWRRQLDDLREEIIIALQEEQAAQDEEEREKETRPVNATLLQHDGTGIQARVMDPGKAGLEFHWHFDIPNRTATIVHRGQMWKVERPSVDGPYICTGPQWRATWPDSKRAKDAVERRIADIELELRRRQIEEKRNNAIFNDPRAKWRQKPATDNQKALALKLWIKLPENCTAGQASELIDAKMAKRKRG